MIKKFLKKLLWIIPVALVLIFIFDWQFKPEIPVPFLGKLTPPQEINGETDQLSPFILYHSGSKNQIEIINPRNSDLYLFGINFNNDEILSFLESDARIIPAHSSYYLDSERLIDWIKDNIGSDNEKLIPIDLLIKSVGGVKYTLKNILYAKIREGNMVIQSQTISFEKNNW